MGQLAHLQEPSGHRYSGTWRSINPGRHVSSLQDSSSNMGCDLIHKIIKAMLPTQVLEPLAHYKNHAKPLWASGLVKNKLDIQRPPWHVAFRATDKIGHHGLASLSRSNHYRKQRKNHRFKPTNLSYIHQLTNETTDKHKAMCTNEYKICSSLMWHWWIYGLTFIGPMSPTNISSGWRGG
jgi:hypothetical protein